MAHASISSPVFYVFNREIEDRVDHRKKLVKARFENSENLFRKNLFSHYGCVNAIEFSNQGDLLVSGGDDRRVLLWKVEQAVQEIGKPIEMKAEHSSNIFCLGFDDKKTKIYSAGNDDQVIVHNLETGEPLDFFLHEKPVYGLSIHPQNGSIFASACDDGRILLYDIRSPKEFKCLAQYKSAFHSVMFSPADSNILATANSKEGVSKWDIRTPFVPLLRYGGEGPTQSCMYVRFNSAGNRLLALRRRLTPVLYSVDSPKYLCEFDHQGYYNSCTMKSCCFAGDNDEYVLSGSDDFNLYMWKIPEEGIDWVDSAHMKLSGHRSIVNQVRYNPKSYMLASSGVEKIVKIWSPFPLGSDCLGGLKNDSEKQEKQRRVFTHNEYIEWVLRRGHFMTHDYSDLSTREDPRMMAFFDSLVQREIEGWSSGDITVGQTLSDNETANLRNSNDGTDSEDSTASDINLMLTVLGTTVTSLSSSSEITPERPSGSPNRITRLIANRRAKLMRQAKRRNLEIICSSTTDSGNQNNSTSTNMDEGSLTKNKSKSKVKSIQRKSNKQSNRTSRTSKKSSTLETESEAQVDTTQPSTSSGVISRRSRYISKTANSDEERSSSSSDDDSIENPLKRKNFKTGDSDSSSVSQKRKHKKSRINVEQETGKRLKKRLKIESDSDEDLWAEAINDARNGAATREKTPARRSSRIPGTPDSGIISGLSTNEKNQNLFNNSNEKCIDSDQEKNRRTLETFRKKVEAAKRSYRKRTQSVSSDSSD